MRRREHGGGEYQCRPNHKMSLHTRYLADHCRSPIDMKCSSHSGTRRNDCPWN
jgi:hypothetical protein